MSIPTVAFSCRMVPEAQEALRRLSVITRWSQSRLLERLILNLQDDYLSGLSEGERQRYKMGTMSFIEFREIARRKKAVALAPQAASLEAPLNGRTADPARGTSPKFGDFLGDAA
jgi:hypothetical protein